MEVATSSPADLNNHFLDFVKHFSQYLQKKVWENIGVTIRLYSNLVLLFIYFFKGRIVFVLQVRASQEQSRRPELRRYLSLPTTTWQVDIIKGQHRHGQTIWYYYLFFQLGPQQCWQEKGIPWRSFTSELPTS